MSETWNIGEAVLTDPAMAPGHVLLAEGRRMAQDWRLGRSLFLETEGVASEAEYKRRAMRDARMMQHAHIGFRSIDRTVEAMGELHARAEEKGVGIDRFGVTLDWTMGYPQDRREGAARGTGIVLTGPEDFARITAASPAAAHFGDFMLGLPGALENTRAAIAAGATAIGNLGQYFTFRLPYWDDDVATTEATLRALGLIAAQEAEILVHSNLDDGFAGLFLDMTSAFGMALIEKHIVEDLIGASASFCFGHHFSAPLTRAAFQAALARETDTPGTMIFGNTVAYQGGAAPNYASLASYLLADLEALHQHHSGHAVNPVPVTENVRIPDVDEILDAQLFAARLADHAAGHAAARDNALIEQMADRLITGGRAFAEAALKGLAERGVDTADPAALMLAIRRLGARRMEALWGAGPLEGARRAPLVAADWAEELDDMAGAWVQRQEGAQLTHRRVALGTTDVHEHGAYLVRCALEGLGASVIEAGVAIDAEIMVARALEAGADAIAVSTYNGIGLGYARRLVAELAARGADIPVLMGGKLNEIPQDSNSSLPVDVSAQIRETGAHPCAGLDDMLAVLKP
ncbi:cobalamin-dependent protein [Roseovarius arcticus]|uniref:cobalamin-dependent protein n=1 Tax=Roseovarius arcticus TaxID=2547404 RepID=UPI00111060F3|nr:cobalamin-dependent protein [Roseovarius arcticus]